MTTTTIDRADPETLPDRRTATRPGRLATSRHRAVRALRDMSYRKLAFRVVMAVFLVLIVASYAVPLWFQLQGDRLLVVTSGSMEPEIGVGSAVVVRPVTSPSQLQVGQVVTFWPSDDTQMVTHRIIAVKSIVRRTQDSAHTVVLDAAGNPVTDPYIQTKGDSVDVPDATLTPFGQVRGIVRDVHPGWGYLLAFAHSGPGRFLLFVPPLVLLLGAEMMSRIPERWSRAQWNRTLIAVRSRESAAAGPLAPPDPKNAGVPHT